MGKVPEWAGRAGARALPEAGPNTAGQTEINSLLELNDKVLLFKTEIQMEIKQQIPKEIPGLYTRRRNQEERKN